MTLERLTFEDVFAHARHLRGLDEEEKRQQNKILYRLAVEKQSKYTYSLEKMVQNTVEPVFFCANALPGHAAKGYPFR